MHSLELMEKLRGIFVAQGIFELPTFPMPLVTSWCHPDLLLAMHKKTNCRGFVFQPMQPLESSFEEIPGRSPDLLWLIDAGVNNFSAVATEILLKLQEVLMPGRAEPAFSLVASSHKMHSAGERGAFWQILFDGVACGSLELFAEVFYAPLPNPIPVLRLELNLLQCFLSPERFKGQLFWSDAASIQQLVSFSAWQSLAEFHDSSPDDLSSQIRLIAADLAREPALCLCRYLRLYCIYRDRIEKDEQLLSSFTTALKEVIAMTGAQMSAPIKSANTVNKDV